ncbi:MAG: glycosyltransferase family 2 protein [Eubacteriales bacterium]
MKSLSVVIPALNEEKAIQGVIKAMPKKELKSLGYHTQVLVVDNGSTDKTSKLAKETGADVIFEPRKGYGRAYKTGFAAAAGEIIATADADQTYPIETIPQLVKLLNKEKLDFITTNRLYGLNSTDVMCLRNKIGNGILNLTCRMLYGLDLQDSQSGMWVFRKDLLKDLILKSDQMPFSEELKIECLYYNKCKWKEIPIEYKKRVGEVKLRGWKDGFHNWVFMTRKRFVR